MSGYKINVIQKEMAKKHNVVIKSSEKKNKKIDVFDKKGNKLASIGGVYPTGKFYKDFATYIDELGLTKAKKKRSDYLKRHAKEPKFKMVKGKKIMTPSYWSDVILWDI